MLKEVVRAEVFNHRRVEDRAQYTGALSIISSLPVCTDISATLLTTLNLTRVIPGSRLGNFTDTTADNKLQIFFTPGTDPLDVFKYTFEKAKLPIQGKFVVVEIEKGFQFTLTLTFFLEQKLVFDYIEVTMLFPNRGPISSISYEPDNSVVFLNKQRNQVIWKRAKPPQTESLTLTGQIKWDSKKRHIDGNPMLIDLNAYADIKFKCTNRTLSTMRIDPASVTVFPTVKFKLNHHVESTAAVLRVWNTNGDIIT